MPFVASESILEMEGSWGDEGHVQGVGNNLGLL